MEPFDSIGDKKMYVIPVGIPNLYEGFALDREGNEIAHTGQIRTKEAAQEAIRAKVEKISVK